jgi:transposase
MGRELSLDFFLYNLTTLRQEDEVMVQGKRYSKEVKDRAVRLVVEHQAEYNSQWSAISSIAPKVGCTCETLRRWVRQAERDRGSREVLSTSERERIKQLERENRELRRANEILRKASAFFAQAELDRIPR